MTLKSIALAAALVGAASVASASTITISAFGPDATNYNTAISTFSNLVSENFEGATVGNVDNGFVTAVGTFSTLGGTGSGGTVSNAPFANDGTKLAIRDGNVYGRTSTTKILTGNSADDQFLDSNDTFGIEWVADLGGSMFNKLLLTLTDAADVGAQLKVSTGNDFQTLVTAGNGNRQIVLVEFANPVSSATVLFENMGNNGLRTNDGFSLDDIAVSAVPIPAGFILLGTAYGGLAAMRRRKTA